MAHRIRIWHFTQAVRRFFMDRNGGPAAEFAIILLPTVFITAHADPASEAQAKAAGARAFLHKPFEDQALFDAVCAAIGAVP